MKRPGPLAAVFAWGGGGAFVVAIVYFAYAFFVRMGRQVPPGTPGAGWRAILVDVLLFSAFALHHSAYARKRVKRGVESLVSPRLERSTYVWAASILFIVVCAAWQPVAGTLWEQDGWMVLPHWAAVVSGVALTAIGVRRLRAFDLAGIDRARGRGGEDAGQDMAVAWPYTLVRHPIYLAWLLMVFGPPVMTATRFVFACVSSAYLVLAVPLEERRLLQQFGEAYGGYKRRVRWRMVPYLY